MCDLFVLTHQGKPVSQIEAFQLEGILAPAALRGPGPRVWEEDLLVVGKRKYIRRWFEQALNLPWASRDKYTRIEPLNLERHKEY